MTPTPAALKCYRCGDWFPDVQPNIIAAAAADRFVTLHLFECYRCRADKWRPGCVKRVDNRR